MALTGTPAARAMQLLQLYESDSASTSRFRTVTHEQLVETMNKFLFHHGAALGIKGWGDNLQSLRDGGVDVVWHFDLETGPGKLGFQVKSYGDFDRNADESFRRTVLAQIAESRQMGLSSLFVALAADLANPSHAQKARGLTADIERMTDGYVFAVSPEKTAGVWQWCQPINVDPMEQMREAGYAWLTVVYDSRGNRNQNSWGKGQGGSWSHPKNTTIRVGDAVHISAIGVCPENAVPEFHFAVQRSGGGFQLRQNWNPTADWKWNIVMDDIGRNVFVKIAVRRPKAYYQFNDADDYTYAIYDVLPPVQAGATPQREDERSGR